MQGHMIKLAILLGTGGPTHRTAVKPYDLHLGTLPLREVGGQVHPHSRSLACTSGGTRVSAEWTPHALH